MNKKEEKIAFIGSLSATANPKEIIKKYSRLYGKEKEINKVPFIVEDGITKLKSKEFVSSINKILGKDLFEVSMQKKEIRAGRGKSRGRKYKMNEGLLIVIGSGENMKHSGVEIVNAKQLSVSHLADGKSGRLAIYTENAIKELNERVYKN